MSANRIRSVNFTNEEKLCCLTIIKKYQNIVENKETGAVSWKQKEAAWKQIEEEFNAQSTIYRNADVLKRFYNNKKKETRKHAALEKRNLNRTGGGSNENKITVDPIFNLTMDIINRKTVFGLENKFDDDGQVQLNVHETGPLIQPVSENVDNNRTTEEIFVQIVEDEDGNSVMMEHGGSEEKWDHYTPSKLKTPKHKNLAQQKPSENNEWSKRRRPPISKTENLSVRYEEVAIIKRNVLELQLEMLKKEKENIEQRDEREKYEREVREKRNAHEFQLKITALQLDIEIKKEQLQALKAVNE